MMSTGIRILAASMILVQAVLLPGCSSSLGKWGNSCQSCETGCQPCGGCNHCGGCNRCGGCGGGKCGSHFAALGGCLHRSSNAIPDTLALGSTVRAHDQVMQTNAEATDFVMYRLDFVGQTAELTSNGKDHILEIAARMRSAPFPVIIEREPNNSDPELDALRRNLVATILSDLGNADAQQRTVVGMPYGPGYWSWPGQMMYYQYIMSYGGFGNGNGGGFGGGGFGGGGGGGFGGGGFF
jgi:hypothetical protein